MTKKERERIYRKAARKIFSCRPSDKYCCGIISSILKDKQGIHAITKMIFPEFFLFEPAYYEDAPLWWSSGLIEPRILALLFCAEMCKD